jgi:hypothetical protein
VDDWSFIRHTDDSWSWLHVASGHVSGSFHHFESLARAVRDAIQYGYDAAGSPRIDLERDRRVRARGSAATAR